MLGSLTGKRKEERQESAARDAEIIARRHASYFAQEFEAAIAAAAEADRPGLVELFLTHAGGEYLGYKLRLRDKEEAIAATREAVFRELGDAAPTLRAHATDDSVTSAVLIMLGEMAHVRHSDSQHEYNFCLQHVFRAAALAQKLPDLVPLDLAEFCIMFAMENEQLSPSARQLIADSFASVRPLGALTAEENERIVRMRLRHAKTDGSVELAWERFRSNAR